MTDPELREVEALINLLEDPDHQVFDQVSNRLIELGAIQFAPLERAAEMLVVERDLVHHLVGRRLVHPPGQAAADVAASAFRIELEQGQIQADHFDCAFQMLETGQTDGYLDGLLSGEISPETLTKLFKCPE